MPELPFPHEPRKQTAAAPLCFDLLSLDGARITPLPPVERRALLHDVITAAGTRHLQFSGEFDYPLELLAAGEKMVLEGVVSKRAPPLSIRSNARLAEDQDGGLACRVAVVGSILLATRTSGWKLSSLHLRLRADAL